MFGIINSSAKNFLVQGLVQKELLGLGEKFLHGRLVDIGCGGKPYKELLSPFVTEHIGVDHEDSFHDKSNVDLFGTAYKVPEKDNDFDSAICTAVLEHLEEPEIALRECFRLLKPGGHAIYSVPFIWHLHEEPRDFYRFTKYGLQYLFEKTGFEIVEIKPLSGFWVTFGQLLTYKIYDYRKSVIKYIGIIDILGVLIQVVSYLLDRVDRSERWTWMYMAVVRRPIQEVEDFGRVNEVPEA